MSNINIHAGDFRVGKAKLSVGSVLISIQYPYSMGDGFSVAMEHLAFSDIKEIAQASEENVKRLGGTVGWGVVGAALLGPVGLVAGLLAGGKGKDITFILKMNDGKKLLATTDSKSYTKIQAGMF